MIGGKKRNKLKQKNKETWRITANRAYFRSIIVIIIIIIMIIILIIIIIIFKEEVPVTLRGFQGGPLKC